MTKRSFPLDQVLYCVAVALGRRGFCATVPSGLHRFLTGEMPSWNELEKFAQVSSACGLILLNQYPQLREAVEKTLRPLRKGQDALESDRQFNTWLDTQKRRFGAQLAAKQVSARDLRRYMVTARGIALRNIEASGVNLNARPEDWE